MVYFSSKMVLSCSYKKAKSIRRWWCQSLTSAFLLHVVDGQLLGPACSQVIAMGSSHIFMCQISTLKEA